MERRTRQEEEGESHQNPFLFISSSKTSSKLQFRKEVSRARWNEMVGMGEVVEKKGSMWATTGIIRDGKLHCHMEEIVFLAEIGALQLVSNADKDFNMEDLYKKIAEEKYGCCWETFEAYRHLKTLGYIVGRHGIPWTMKAEKSFDSISQKNVPSIDGVLDLNMESKVTDLMKGMQLNEMKPNFDVYLPSTKFKKSSPGDPAFLVYVLKENPPSRQDVESAERRCGGIPIKFCSVDHGLISFLFFDKVTLPVLP